MSNQPALSYHQAAARGASPIGQVIALYDTVLRDFGRALAAMHAGNVESRVFELNHAVSVIGYLLGVLDHEHGGEAAKHFERLYKVTLGLIVKINFQPKTESLEELIDMFGGIRQAWYQMEQQSKDSTSPTTASRTTSPNDESEIPRPNPVVEDLEAQQTHWSV